MRQGLSRMISPQRHSGRDVVGDDRGDADAVEFHLFRIVAGRKNMVRRLEPDREPDRMNEDELPPTEAAREKRRDRDAEARSRAGMRTGLAKQFKQRLDVQRQRAEEVERREDESAAEPEAQGARKGRRRRP